MTATRIAVGGTRQAGQQAADAPVTGLSQVRDELEHHPRDPFEVDRERAADALSVKWAGSYSIKPCVGGFEAVRRHGPRVTLTASTPDELDQLMTEDSAGGAQ